MKKYYINNGEQNLGPFDLNDLKSKGIGRDTLVWFFGLHRWSKARGIPELEELFRTSWGRRKEGFRAPADDETASLFKDRLLLFVVLGLILGFGILFYSFYITSSISRDEQRSHNELQESRELFWKERSSGQGDMAFEYVQFDKKEMLTSDDKGAVVKRMAQIEIELDMARQNLEAAKQELLAAQSFQFLRMSNDMKKNIADANKKIHVWKQEIKALEVEMEGLKTVPCLPDEIE